MKKTIKYAIVAVVLAVGVLLVLLNANSKTYLQQVSDNASSKCGVKTYAVKWASDGGTEDTPEIHIGDYGNTLFVSIPESIKYATWDCLLSETVPDYVIFQWAEHGYSHSGFSIRYEDYTYEWLSGVNRGILIAPYTTTSMSDKAQNHY